MSDGSKDVVVGSLTYSPDFSNEPVHVPNFQETTNEKIKLIEQRIKLLDEILDRLEKVESHVACVMK